MSIFTRLRAEVLTRLRQASTWLGVALNIVALNWTAIQQNAPALAQQLAQSNPRAAEAINIGVAVLGAVLMIWNSTKGKADGQ